MPRRLRQDHPGAYHHVMNRGLAKRTVFVGTPEIRYFESRLAREVRSGEIEVHGFCFLTTHFHLLLKSPRGHLSEVMRRVENTFVRWFNRRHRRDGALFRGRFTSRLVETEEYLANVRCYIDQNPVMARLSAIPAEYPHGSAYLRASKQCLRWLAPFSKPTGRRGATVTPHAAWVIERRLEKQVAEDPLDDLFEAAPAPVQAWMARKARLADGMAPTHCLVSPESLQEAIEDVRESIGSWPVRPGVRSRDGWKVLLLGMSHDMIGLSTTETSLHTGAGRSAVGLAIQQHRRLLIVDPTYLERASIVLRHALEATYGKRRNAAGASPRPDDRARLEYPVDRA
jgi:REP element-mobilizing transposase RayT